MMTYIGHSSSREERECQRTEAAHWGRGRGEIPSAYQSVYLALHVLLSGREGKQRQEGADNIRMGTRMRVQEGRG